MNLLYWDAQIKQFIKTVIGDYEPFEWASIWFFISVAVVISLLASSLKRKDKTTQFSWTYMFVDNFKRWFLSVLLIYVAARFLPFSESIKKGDATYLFFISMGFGAATWGVEWLLKQVDKKFKVFNMPTDDIVKLKPKHDEDINNPNLN